MKKGRVARSVGASRGGGNGLLVIPELPAVRAVFNADTSCADNAQPSSLEVDDEVAFRLMDHLRNDVKMAKDLQLLCKGSDRRELGPGDFTDPAVPLSQFRLGQTLPAKSVLSLQSQVSSASEENCCIKFWCGVSMTSSESGDC